MILFSVMATLGAAQNPDGGFGGGNGQIAHCAPSYAAVLSLAMVDGLDIIDRKAMYVHGIVLLIGTKMAEGGFSVTVGGEIDVRSVRW
jgi:protein farnesyltransferase subunit beta